MQMKKTVCIVIASVALILVNSLPGFAYRGGHRGYGGIGISIGPVWGGAYYPYYPYYPYYAVPPTVAPQQPDVYVQPAPQAEEPAYWYYCQSPEGYYPYVKRCPSGWLRVVPSPPSEDQKE